MKEFDIYTSPPTETIYGQIVAKANNYETVPDGKGGRRIIKNRKVRQYEESFLQQCRLYAGRMISTPFELIAVIYYRSRAYDLDNSLKTLLDCLQYAKAIANDNLCTRITADKAVDPRHPRVEFTLIAERPQPTLFDDVSLSPELAAPS